MRQGRSCIQYGSYLIHYQHDFTVNNNESATKNHYKIEYSFLHGVCIALYTHHHPHTLERNFLFFFLFISNHLYTF